MTEPIVFISRFRIVDGQRGAVESMLAVAVDLIASTKPRTALFAAFLDPAGSELRIVHAFADPAAITEHFEGSSDRSRAIEDLLVPAGFELYGAVPTSVVEQLRREAAEAGIDLAILGPAGGFLRTPVRSVD